MNYTKPNFAQLCVLDKYQRQFAKDIATPIKDMYKIGGLTPKILEQRVQGVSRKTWESYGQPSFKSSRSIHLLAILCWISGVGIHALFFKNQLAARQMEKFSAELVALTIYCNQMSQDDFRYFFTKVLCSMDMDSTQRKIILSNIISLDLTTLENQAPAVIDADLFGEAYYSSIGQMLRNFRKSIGETQKRMAYYMNIPIDRYARVEKGLTSTVPAELVLRFKMAFQLSDTVQFISKMMHYDGFVKCRQAQQEVENNLIIILQSASDNQTQYIVDMAKDMARYSRAGKMLQAS